MAPGFLVLTVEFYWHVNLVQISPQLLRDLYSSCCQRNVFFAPNSVTSTTVWCPLVCCHPQLPMFASLFKIIKTLDVHLRMCWIQLHTQRSTPNDCAVHTFHAACAHIYTHPLWNDARSRRWIWRSIRCDPIRALWYPQAQPSKPLSWIWEKLLQAFEASIWGLGKFVLLIWAI